MMGQTHKVTMYELLRHLRNFFPGLCWQCFGQEIEDGRLIIPALDTGSYYLIEGSRRNDGVHKYGDTDLRTETFSGYVTELLIPPEVVSLLDEINTWQEANAKTLESPYTSESFGGYSYTKAGGNSAGVDVLSWQTQFAPQLKVWRKI